MLKKIILFICSLVLVLINVAALKVPSEFYVHGSANNYVSEILDMTEDELKDYVKENHITYLAVNKNNTKQIKRIEYKDSFSKKVENFLSLKDKEILGFAEELSGVPNAKGEIIEKDAQKYLKVVAKTKDSGGEYILTQYITVKDSKREILSFSTSADEETDYIEDVFNSQFKSKSQSALKVVATIGIVLFSILAAIVLWAIIKETFVKEE